MLTGEYLVLKGAKSLALPTILGQELYAKTNYSQALNWKATVKNKPWFDCQIDIRTLLVSRTNNKEVSETLVTILKAVKEMNPTFLSSGYQVNTNVEFDTDWGLGSSSTLIANIANWANCDPYELNRRVFKGSGYDIACAMAVGPIQYRLKKNEPKVKALDYHPEFKENLAFVWLNQKQDTRKGIALVDREKKFKPEIKKLNAITKRVRQANNLDEFMDALVLHEQLISSLIEIEPVQMRLFPEFDGVVKSLGAWGGDFVLVASTMPFEEMKTYFYEKGYNTVLKYNELIK